MALLYRMGTGNGSGSDLKPFIINFTCHSGFIGKTVTMEFQGTPHAGETVDNVSGTVASDGTLTLYPMHDGLWKYYATSDLSGYHEKTITLEKWGNYPVELIDPPNGATVTPTDDVQTWLHCANVWNKSYTTISEVVADTTTLNTLISDNNASDYLARSTTFATDICSNESAMTYIGLNDYCARKLLSDNTWLEAICNSTYFEKVLNVKVPTMTSNTAPSGEVSFSSAMECIGYEAFDGNDASSWNSSTYNGFLRYKFTKPVCVKEFYLMPLNYDKINQDKYYNCRVKNFTITASKTGNDNDWTELYSGQYEIGNLDRIKLNNNEFYSYYSINILNHYDVDNTVVCGINTLQYYGREEA